MLAEVKWIKITTDIFDDEKILLIESLPDAYAIIVVWFKLLCLAGKQNNSGVFMMNNQIAYTDKMLATIFRMKETTVQLALQTFQQFGMVEIIDGVITIPNWGKHQNLDQLENKKEYMRNYMQEYRAKQKLLAGKTDCKTNSKTNVSEADKDKELEEEKEEEKKIYIAVVSYLNEKAGTKYKTSSSKTRTLINARIREGYTMEDFKTVIDNKCADWLNTDYAKFLRPETLFSPKFEGYLNQRGVGKHGRSENTASTVGSSVGAWV